MKQRSNNRTESLTGSIISETSKEPIGINIIAVNFQKNDGTKASQESAKKIEVFTNPLSLTQ